MLRFFSHSRCHHIRLGTLKKLFMAFQQYVLQRCLHSYVGPGIGKITQSKLPFSIFSRNFFAVNENFISMQHEETLRWWMMHFMGVYLPVCMCFADKPWLHIHVHVCAQLYSMGISIMKTCRSNIVHAQVVSMSEHMLDMYILCIF